jgi:hypothetical protein
MAKFFDDIGLDGSDLLNKGFPSGSSVKVTAETKTDNGVSLIATGRRFVKDKNVAVELALEPKFDWAAKNVEFSATANTSNEYTGTFVLKDFATKGTKFTSVGTFNDKGASIKETAQFKNDNVATKASYVQPIDNEKPLTIDGSIAGAFEKKYFGGANASFTPSKGDKAASLLWGSKLGFDHSDFQAHLFANSTAKNLFVGAGWFQKATPDLKVAAVASADVNKVAGPTATLGSEYRFDALTALKTKLNVQTHVDNKPLEARLGVGLKQSLSANFTATIGADVNVRQLLGVNAGGDHTFGLEVKII